MRQRGHLQNEHGEEWNERYEKRASLAEDALRPLEGEKQCDRREGRTLEE